MTSSDKSTAQRFIEHAETVNETAALALRLETRDATAIQAKISFGLSLQAAELASKAILICTGLTPDEARARHRRHDVYQMLLEADERIKGHPNRAIKLYGKFLTWVPIVDGIEFATSLGEYFEQHFSHGATALPRNYFYPDLEQFAGPEPPQALHVMVEHLIECASQVRVALEGQ